jgi:hypothetical protein
MASSYPLRIRFWYFVHNYAERLWHWVWYAKLQPWHRSQEIQVPPSFRLIEETPDRKVYVGGGGYGAKTPVKYEGSYSYEYKFVQAPEQRR